MQMFANIDYVDVQDVGLHLEEAAMEMLPHSRELVIYTGLYVHSDGSVHDEEEKD